MDSWRSARRVRSPHQATGDRNRRKEPNATDLRWFPAPVFGFRRHFGCAGKCGEKKSPRLKGRDTIAAVRRVVVLGPGGAGKSTFSARLGAVTGLPVTELDHHFWQPGLVATPPDKWAAQQRELAARPAWILDGDLGPYDVVGVRLAAADTVIVLDFSRWRCAWRALRRSRERMDFWMWLWRWRRRSLPLLLEAIGSCGPRLSVHILRTPGSLDRFLALVASGGGDRQEP